MTHLYFSVEWGLSGLDRLELSARPTSTRVRRLGVRAPFGWGSPPRNLKLTERGLVVNYSIMCVYI